VTFVLSVLGFFPSINYNKLKIQQKMFGGKDMDVIALNQARRRKGSRPPKVEGPGKVLWLDQLSDAVLLRVAKRQAAREIEQLAFLLKVTDGDSTMLPTPDQMEEIENGTIEF
jgi:hypothetical protein